jgi:heme/copper-type cytochrome/quinol oxidase subunit 2
MTQSVPNQPYTQQPVGEDPGKTMGIVGLVLAFVASVIGLIVSAIAYNKSKKAGFKNTPALVGIIIGALSTLITIIVIIVSVASFSALMNKCAELGPGTHQEGGVTYTCPG